jgi:hypothetical protein
VYAVFDDDAIRQVKDTPAHDAGWNEQLHPRGQPKNRGEFVAGGGAHGAQKASGTHRTPWIAELAERNANPKGTPTAAPQPAVQGAGSEPVPWIEQLARQNAAPHPGVISKAVHTAVHGTGNWADEFSQEDFHILKEHLAPNSPARRSYGSRIRDIAAILPRLLIAHFKEIGHQAWMAAGALKSLATGRRPSGEQWKGLRRTAFTFAVSGAMMMLTGEPTGVAAHAAEHAVEHVVEHTASSAIGHLATEFGHELVSHTVVEHLAKLGLGAARFGMTAAGIGVSRKHGEEKAKDVALDAAGFDADSIRLLQQFLMTMAHVATTLPIDDQKLYASLPPARANGQNGQAHDALPSTISIGGNTYNIVSRS